MLARTLRSDQDWMAVRLAAADMTEFDRVSILTTMAPGVMIGSILCAMWRKFARA
jgi:hypothetical protein